MRFLWNTLLAGYFNKHSKLFFRNKQFGEEYKWIIESWNIKKPQKLRITYTHEQYSKQTLTLFDFSKKVKEENV